MSSNANTIDARQMHANSSSTSAKIPTPQTTLPPSSPIKTTHAIVDVAVFASTNHADPVQVRDGTAHLSFVPIGGTFTSNAAAQAEPTNPSIVDKDGENHAPSPHALSPIPPRSEKSASPSPIPIPPRPQPDNLHRTDSDRRSLFPSPSPGREPNSPEAMSTLWKRVKALSWYHAAHQRQYPGGFSLPGLAKTTIMVKRLTTMTEPPLHKSDFM